MADENIRPIIKKVKKVVGGGAHGGAWKVAYADFVTAMMAFFMLLWLLNVAPPETLSGLADYFTPTTAVSSSNSGGNDPLNAGKNVVKGSNAVIDVQLKPQKKNEEEERKSSEGGNEKSEPTPEEIRDLEIQDLIRQQEAENEDYEDLIEKINISIQQSQTLNEFSEHIQMEITEDGLKIQLIDRDRRPMFRRGTDEMYSFAQNLLREIGASVQNLSNRVTIEGHTDNTSRESRQGYDNWDLSADRANRARRVLFSAGVTSDRFFAVLGKASTAPLYPRNPERNENRRIAILLMRETDSVPRGYEID
ncbi:flagellar motor protein MotB [Temperatibacter marinus]|uniref:Flagellar motor protein MotB n=1 Tax=Temperatibacter marinus TaxID=1456591 RepID=A0AA52EH88_9PROT|nr:flagellar motor protein MotB [Temperatibacter marinus]WND02479.1 flagellar motor protein MotB [Temperatibacter marinus]